MFLRRLRVQRRTAQGLLVDCPLRWMDSFAMRSFTNDAIFDDTLPVADGCLEAGNLVPIDSLHTAMQTWFQRKGYLRPGESLLLTEVQTASQGNAVPQPTPERNL